MLRVEISSTSERATWSLLVTSLCQNREKDKGVGVVERKSRYQGAQKVASLCQNREKDKGVGEVYKKTEVQSIITSVPPYLYVFLFLADCGSGPQ